MEILKQAILKRYKYQSSSWGIAINGIHVRGIKDTVTASFFKSSESLTMTKKEIEQEKKENKQLSIF